MKPKPVKTWDVVEALDKDTPLCVVDYVNAVESYINRLEESNRHLSSTNSYLNVLYYKGPSGP